MLRVTTILVLLALTSATKNKKEKEICPQPVALANFNATKFAGTWYDVAHTKTENEDDEDEILNCDQDRYVVTSQNEFSVSSFSYNATTKKTTILEGKAEIPANNSGILNFTLRYRNPDSKNINKVVNYVSRVLATDYSTYAVLWSCDDDTKPTGNALVYSRKQHPDVKLVKSSIKILEHLKISDDEIIESNQFDCPKYF